MKRVKIAVPLILISVLSVSFMSIFFLKRTEKKADVYIAQIESAVNEDDFESCLAVLSEFKKFWHNRERLYLFFVRHEEMHGIEIGIEQMIVFAQCRDKVSVMGEVYMMRATLSHISESELPLIENII